MQNEQQNKTPSISGFSWVDGINSARAQSIQYGTSWIFFDVKDPVFYIKTVGYDGIPQPLFIASYKQISESELPNTAAAQHQMDMSDYLKKSDIDMSAYATKEDVSKILSALEVRNDYVTNEEFEDRVMRLIQEKMTSTRQKKSTVKDEA